MGKHSSLFALVIPSYFLPVLTIVAIFSYDHPADGNPREGPQPLGGHRIGSIALARIRPVTVVPFPGSERTSMIPPRASKRSAMPCKHRGHRAGDRPHGCPPWP
jgi:hypothetical protein